MEMFLPASGGSLNRNAAYTRFWNEELSGDGGGVTGLGGDGSDPIRVSREFWWLRWVVVIPIMAFYN